MNYRGYSDGTMVIPQENLTVRYLIYREDTYFRKQFYHMIVINYHEYFYHLDTYVGTTNRKGLGIDRG